MSEAKPRLVKITLIQRGPAPEDKDKTVESNLRLVDEVGAEKPDFICFNELSTTPYFCVVRDDKYFDWAEPIPGPITQAFGEKAKKYGCTIIVPMYEKFGSDYYNSAVVLGPDGKLVYGTMPDGSQVHRFAKAHVGIKGETKLPPAGKLVTEEPYYFKRGPGFPVFHTPKATIGICICLDRHYPESCRSVALGGAEIIFIPSDSPLFMVGKGMATEEMLYAQIQTRALENQLWVACCNMGGYEVVAGKTTQFYGRSCIAGPTGDMVAKGPSTQPAIVSATIDLEAINSAREFLGFWKRRRPESYHPSIVETTKK